MTFLSYYGTSFGGDKEDIINHHVGVSSRRSIEAMARVGGLSSESSTVHLQPFRI